MAQLPLTPQGWADLLNFVRDYVVRCETCGKFFSIFDMGVDHATGVRACDPCMNAATPDCCHRCGSTTDTDNMIPDPGADERLVCTSCLVEPRRAYGSLAALQQRLLQA